MDILETLEQQLDQILLVDRPSLRRQWQHLRRRRASQDDQIFRDELARLEANLERARRRREQRDGLVPPIRFDLPLPILNHRLEIQQALRQRQTLVVAGETGSGKSTQLPKICLESGLGRVGLIGHTQPRRIAARSIAARLADELGVPLGQQVGYKIRFQDKTIRQTLVKLMTDGVLLAETQSDRFLDQYEVIILDEAHERSLNIDFLLGYLHQLLARRSDLHLIITSATIDARRFSEHFADASGPAPIIEVSGRGYPVEIRYRPLTNDEGDESDWIDGVMAAVHEVARIDRGDVLVFLPTERDIREMARRLRTTTLPGDGARTTEILPLYARLSTAEQNRIFQSSDYRRVVLATNVAESSLTVPNVRYVVDTGIARISRYSPRSKILRLPIEPVSRASANQRAGRCGRVAPGVCIRLYDEDDYERRDEYTTPEIRRTNLAAVILQAKALRLGEIEDYPFLDPPRPEAVRDGYKTLFEIQAIDRDRNLTEVGWQLAKMPVDPRIGRMILAGATENCLHDVLIVAAALELQDPRERPHDRQQQADQRHERFVDKDSDFVSYLKIWDFYHHLKETTSRGKLRKACLDNYLSHNRLREWTDIHRQLQEIAADGKLLIGPPRRGDYAALHRSLLAGLLSGVAYRSSDFEYTGASGVTMNLWPGSGLYRERHAWIVAAERVETTRRYARTVARISPQWVEPLAEHLVKRSYSDPRWSRKSRMVVASEKVSLMGMPIVVNRQVPFGRIDPEQSRRIFIQEGMVDERAEAFDPFLRANQSLRKELDELAARTRRRAFLLDDYSFYAFYDDRVPRDVHDVNGLRQWFRAATGGRERLTMKREDLIREAEPVRADEGFPDQLRVGNLQLPVRYHFSPGAEDDGVTVCIPDAALNQLTSEQAAWLVPGLIEEKVTALIRSLPKSLRRNFVPARDAAKQVVEQLKFGEGPLLSTLASMLSRIASEHVEPGDFQPDKLPDHLRMNIQVIDDSGDVKQMGRDLDVLRAVARTASTPTDATPEGGDDWKRDCITSWDFGPLPLEVTIVRGGIPIAAYPALIDRQQSIALCLLDTAAQANARSRRGVSRLYFLAQQKSIRAQIRWLPKWDQIQVWAASVITTDALKDQLSLRIAELAFVGQDGIPRSEEAFIERMNNAVERIGIATQEVAAVLPRLFEAYHQARGALEDLSGSRYAEARADMINQLDSLFAFEPVVEVPWQWLTQFPRYLNSMVHRIDKLKSSGPARDAEAARAIETFWQKYVCQQRHNDQRHRVDPELVEFRWMIEEYRVSLFAQPLGTSIKISPQRLEKQWAKVERA